MGFHTVLLAAHRHLAAAHHQQEQRRASDNDKCDKDFCHGVSGIAGVAPKGAGLLKWWERQCGRTGLRGTYRVGAVRQ